MAGGKTGKRTTRAKRAESAAARWDRLDGLINNAAVFRPTPLTDATLDDWSSMMNVNLRAPFLLSQAAMPWLAESAGSIVNVTDIYVDRPKANHAIYCATKAGLAGLTRALARDLGPKIRVNAVAPGYIASSGMDHYPADAAPMLRAMASTVPLGRFGTESETAAGIVFLLSPAASFISGSTLRIDGARPQVRLGWPMGEPADAARQRDAVKPFNGFHLAAFPEVLKHLEDQQS
jgi:citronellol/citronellal dehydrogenase